MADRVKDVDMVYVGVGNSGVDAANINVGAANANVGVGNVNVGVANASGGNTNNGNYSRASKRVSDFLFSCTNGRKRKVDYESEVVKKRAEKRRIEDQILRLQRQIANLSQKLRAKEVIRETLEDQIQTLIKSE
jgi:hypothetical protein